MQALADAEAELFATIEAARIAAEQQQTLADEVQGLRRERDRLLDEVRQLQESKASTTAPPVSQEGLLVGTDTGGDRRRDLELEMREAAVERREAALDRRPVRSSDGDCANELTRLKAELQQEREQHERDIRWYRAEHERARAAFQTITNQCQALAVVPRTSGRGAAPRAALLCATAVAATSNVAPAGAAATAAPKTAQTAPTTRSRRAAAGREVVRPLP